MRVINTITEMQTAARELRSGGTLALVPTMGALHAGHLSLIDAAKRDCAHVVATIFVNPLQFGPNEDFDRYPRTFDADCAGLEREGVNILFAPTERELYPQPQEITVRPGAIGELFEGEFRPGFFQG